MNFENQRRLMVKKQLRSRGIKDERVLDAMESIERHRFVNEEMSNRAYDDCALPIGENQTISQPYMVAVMTELLELKGNEKILEIGAGSGYQSAVLSKLAREVFSLERIESLALRSGELLRELGISNVHVIVADGTLGYLDSAPFDGIIVTAGAPDIPDQYLEQLNVNGSIVIPIGSRHSQVLYKVTKTADGIEKTMSTSCIFVPLIGKSGWSEKEVC
jgi:protein-L-isoaspartate(D-aspartate) O-methyltransferase